MKSFHKLTAVALCLAMLLSMAACASPANSEATPSPAPVSTQAPQAEATPAPETESTPTQADVIVVGGGAAGLSAAISAAQEGASVILLEKMENVGGSTALCAGAAATAARDSDPEGSYTADMLYDHWVEVSQGHIDTALARKIADMSADTIDWVESLGIDMMYVESTYIGKPLVLVTTYLDERSRIASGVGGPILVEGLLSSAQSLGVQVLTSTPATRLLTDAAGTVTGVAATDSQGNELTFEAGSVILATGGFTANKELLSQVCPDITDVAVIGGAGNTGDAIAMASELGASVTYCEETGNGCYTTGDPNFSIYQIGMDVNEAGERFMNEANFYGRAYMCMRDQIRQGHSSFHILFDSLSPYLEDCEAGVANGTVTKAETLEELAALIGVDAGALVDTARQYDSMKGQEDTEFGKPAELMYGMSEGPFYAVKLVPIALGTFGGLSIDTEGRILKEDGTAIPGLYGAGECAAATFFYNEYPYSGSCIQYCLSTGRISGANAAQGR